MFTNTPITALSGEPSVLVSELELGRKLHHPQEV
jgi:hypothetical protein